MMIGPTHYEGWTCKGCKYHKHNSYTTDGIHYGEQDYCGVSGKHVVIKDVSNTPFTCPYLKHAIEDTL